MKKLILLLILTSLPLVSFSQITLCNNATPICGSLTFGNTIGATGLGSISCLGSSPNPHWSIFKVGNTGSLVFGLNQGNNAPSYNNLDVDYVCWGPFNDIPNCSSMLYAYPVGNTAIPNNIIGCSYSASPTETITIPNASSGQYYVILTTNFSGQSGTIILSQTNSASPGAGSTICDYAVVNDSPDDIPFESTANFSVSTLNVNTYRWQMSLNGTDWANLYDGGTNPVISGSATNSLDLTNLPSSYIGNYFRVNLTTNSENIYSNYARITGALQSETFNNITNEILITSENITIGNLTGTMKIFDINGRILTSKEITPNSSINISSYSKGIYILNFEDINNMNNHNQKFIKN